MPLPPISQDMPAARKPTAPPSAVPLRHRRRIALVAHDNRKPDLLEWARFNAALLARHDLCGTGTTSAFMAAELRQPVERLQSGPLGGDLQLGTRIVDGDIDLLVFFWDPLQPQPHDPDVKALLRIAVVWNIPMASNRATADYLVSSPLLTNGYERTLPDHGPRPSREGVRAAGSPARRPVVARQS